MVECLNCDQSFDPTRYRWRCPACGEGHLLRGRALPGPNARPGGPSLVITFACGLRRGLVS
jgi:hypothetical protein